MAASSARGWSRGSLEIHHISTGRGNATLCVFPDGTTLLIDAGAVRGDPALLAPLRPDGSRRPGEWIARYVQRRLAETGTHALDVALLTHFHPDHMGDVATDSPASRSGPYRLSGITDVAEVVPLRRIIDRGYPRYDYPAERHDGTLDNYRAFIASAKIRGTRPERFAVGSARQLRLEHAATAKFPSFSVRNIAANGEVWTGRGEGATAYFPQLQMLPAEDLPDENACSCALKLAYGRFAYFAGGDLTFTTADGNLPWRDVETPAARAAGPVDAAAVDHHGYYDAGGAGFVRALRSRVYVLQAWHATHPALSTLDRIYSTRLYSGPRDVFATAIHPASAAVNERLIGRLRATAGHIVIRVAPGGSTYTVDVVEDRDESDRVLSTFGPYDSTANKSAG
ncbi:MAG: beta-lactamase domain protein [Candidatus Eremiobacteraeota bacterium]|nr:beta-lactamase domain protein [Candidatus Eremiobacteraeota bacterium]